MTGEPHTRIAWFLHPDRPRWVRDGTVAWLAAGGKLQHPLGLDRRGQTLTLRNYWLGQAWAMTATDLKPWPRALALHRDIERFRTTVWRETRDLAAPPARLSNQGKALWRAFRAGAMVPGSARMISDIVKSWGVEISQKYADDEADEKPNRNERNPGCRNISYSTR